MPHPSADDRPLSAAGVLWLNAAIGIGHFLVLFNTGAYLPMIPRVAGSLGVDPAFIDWTQSNFFLAMALAFVTASLWAARLGETQSLLCAFALFALAALICTATHDYDVFLAARMLQGYAGGLTIPLSLTLILRHYTPNRRHIGLTLWGVAAITPFTLGPALGGWITDNLGWRALFWLDIPVALLVTLWLYALAPPARTQRPQDPVDWLGLAALVTALLSLQSALNVSEVTDWLRTPRVVHLLALAAVAAILFSVRSQQVRHPVVDVDLLKRRNFAVGGAVLFLTAFWFQGLLALYVVQFQLLFGYSAWRAGLLLLPMAFFSKITSVLTHRILHRADPRFLATTALLGFAATSLWVSSYDRTASFTALLWPQAVTGVFLGLLFPPFAAIALSGLQGTRELRGAAFLNLLRAGGQALGIPAITVLWLRRRALHLHFLGEGDVFTAIARHRAARTLAAHGLTPARARAELAASVAHHAGMLAFNEVFYIGGLAFALLAFLPIFACHTVFAEPDLRVDLAIVELVEP
ncbi:MAG: DHA2 family efflux MFS transporter permease subunit [Gammaproteobacteria bacterium]|nr:DHA2 family efflux MFS transporter permease subunit [Gammaproteobacteria bacterium]